jgi:hypothetical protein
MKRKKKKRLKNRRFERKTYLERHKAVWFSSLSFVEMKIKYLFEEQVW